MEKENFKTFVKNEFLAMAYSLPTSLFVAGIIYLIVRYT